MIRTAFRFSCFAVLALSAAGAASAATVTPKSGKVLLSSGKGFKPVAGETTAKVGDTVMVQPGGTALITFDDGCTKQVGHGSVVTIPATSPCALEDVQQPETLGANAPPLSFTLSAIAQVAIGAHRIHNAFQDDRPASP